MYQATTVATGPEHFIEALIKSENPAFTATGIAIIVKLTNSCNYGCSYCGVSGPLVSNQKKEFNGYEHILDVIKIIANSRLKYVDFIMHGGEPLLLGKRFFKKLIEAETKYAPNIMHNSIQTNGSLIDQGWINLFKENCFLVGVSLDGPEDIQNVQRASLSGDSFELTMNCIRKLIANDVQFGCMGVATDKTINYDINKLFDFYVGNGIKTFDFIPQEPVFDRANDRQLTEDVYFNNKYAEFCMKLFDKWFDHNNPNIHIPIFEDIIRTMVGKPSKICQIGEGVCGHLVFTLYPDGTLQPCDKFPRAYSDNAHVIANVSELSSFDEVFGLQRQKAIINSQIESFKTCKGCPWLSECRGGCVFDRYMYSKLGMSSTYSGCATYKMYEHISSVIRQYKSN